MRVQRDQARIKSIMMHVYRKEEQSLFLGITASSGTSQGGVSRLVDSNVLDLHHVAIAVVGGRIRFALYKISLFSAGKENVLVFRLLTGQDPPTATLRITKNGEWARVDQTPSSPISEPDNLWKGVLSLDHSIVSVCQFSEVRSICSDHW